MTRLVPTAALTHRYPRVTSARVLSAGFNLAVGLRLLGPDDILGNPRNPSYALLDRHFFGDVPLGVMLVALGAVMTVGLYTDRAGRVVGAATAWSVITWGLVAVDITLISLSQLGTLVYLLVAAMNCYAYAHLTAWRAQLRRGSGGPS